MYAVYIYTNQYQSYIYPLNDLALNVTIGCLEFIAWDRVYSPFTTLRKFQGMLSFVAEDMEGEWPRQAIRK